jgi:hypothetical protein
MYKIGYVDEDLDQVKKFERKLRSSFSLIGYDIPKGLPLEELVEQIYNSDIDLLMVDYLMCDKGHLSYNGDEVVREFLKIKPQFPVIVFTHRESEAFPMVDNPNIIYDKGKALEDIGHFSKVLLKNIDINKRFISERKDRIQELIIKREKSGLSSFEKEELFTKQLDLNNLDQKIKEAPTYLINDLKLDKLSDATNEAEELLNLLKKGQ